MAVKILVWILFISVVFLPDSIAYENLSHLKYAKQSSNYTVKTVASNAVDGVTNSNWPDVAAVYWGTFVWWYVDLEAPRNIHSITIYYREGVDVPSRFGGFSLFISNENFTTQGGYNCSVNSANPLREFSVVCMNVGRYVTLYNEREQAGKGYGAILELREVKVFGCKDSAMYGTDCGQLCPENCRRSRCYASNGSCFSCNDGFHGSVCDKPCSPGNYGENCIFYCNKDCLDEFKCDSVTGNCEGGCKAGWIGQKCDQSCENGKYGIGCLNDCGKCLQGAACNKVNGICASCDPGYQTSLCNTTCGPGFYGKGCLDECSWNCKNNDTCNFINGVCSSGCADGWIESLCNKQCQPGYYGHQCLSTCSVNCETGALCDHVTGTCNHGCKDGYYGLRCVDQCSGHCYDNAICDKSDGKCSGGCAAGWKSEKCNQTCDPGEYGENCTNTCGNCKNRTACNIITGNCESGCGPGYTEQLCITMCPPGMYGEDCRYNCTGNCFNSQTCDYKTGECGNGCVAGYTGKRCDKECEDRFYGSGCVEECSMNCRNNDTCNFVNGSCPNGCLNEWISDTCKIKKSSLNKPSEEAGSGPIIGGVCGALAAVVFVAIAIFIIRRRKPEKYFSSLQKETEHRSNDSTNRKERMSAAKYPEEGNAYENAAGLKTNLHDINISIEDNEQEDTYYNTAPKPAEVYKDIKIEDLHNYIQDMLKNEKAAFISQYEGIFKGEEYPCDAGKKQENIPKNRFKTTFPYDHSRVILRSKFQQTSDYINANFIENIEGERTYIAAQGPKPNTVVDFWTMVWQENVQKIVMVTNLKEGAKIKCEQYWPDAGQTMKKGDLIIKIHEERHYAFYTIRILKITRNMTKEDRLLYHFHYTQWMDHDIPDSLGLVIFHRHVMKTTVQQKNSLTMVHCSAGIGRTGTYIALDALYRNGKKTGKVNVPAYVKVMRKDRMSMIQNVNQYITVFNSLEEAFRSTPHAIPRSKFVEEVENQNKPDKPANSKHIRTTFNELKSLRPQYTKRECQAGRDNLEANYTKSVIPVDKFRCNLYSYSKGRGNYYNAVFMQSYTKRDGLISAQFPLPANTEDFLRLLQDFESHIVVSVNPLSQIESTSIWMPINHSGLTIGDFSVSLDSQPATNGHVKSTKVSIKKEGFASHALEVFESTTWNTRDPLPTDPSPVLELVTQAQKALKSHPDGAIVVLSVDGASKCGVFCAVFNALQQVHLDDEVDIFTIVRHLQIRRPQMFSNMDEYQFCFKAVAEHLNEPPEDYDNIYANC